MSNDSIIITETGFPEIDTVPATTSDTVIASPQETSYADLPLLLKTDTIPATYRYHTEMREWGSTAARHEGNALPISVAADSGVLLLLIVVFMAVALSYKRGAKYLSHIFGSLFKTNRRNSIFDDTTINETQMRIALLTLTFFTEGVALYYGMLQPAITEQAAVFPLILSCMLLCCIYYLLQRGIYALLGNTFADTTRAALFNESFVSVHLIIGLFFTPAVLTMIFLPEYAYNALWACILLYAAARIIIVIMGIRIFLPRNFEILYIILYLCALEIAPLLVMGKAIPIIYRFVELNLL